MRAIYFFLLAFSVTSCVSPKKHTSLLNEFEKTRAELASKEEENKTLHHKLENSIEVNNHQKGQIEDLKESVSFLKKSNENLTERINELIVTAKSNTEIMKKTVTDLDVQTQLVYKLSFGHDKRDTLNGNVLKKDKKKMSGTRLKKSMEKLGFVTY